MRVSRLPIGEVPNLYSVQDHVLRVIDVELLGLYQYSDLDPAYDSSKVKSILDFGHRLLEDIESGESTLGTQVFKGSRSWDRGQTFAEGFDLSTLDAGQASFIIATAGLGLRLKDREDQRRSHLLVNNGLVTDFRNLSRVNEARIYKPEIARV